MAEKFTIPKDIDFHFEVTVKDKNSFLNRDLTTMSSAMFTVFEYGTENTVFQQSMIATNPANGILKCSLTSAQTSMLTPWLADPADRAFVQATYHATISIQFTNGEPVSVYIDQVYVTPTGV